VRQLGLYRSQLVYKLLAVVGHLDFLCRLMTKALLWPPCVADADIIFCSCGLYLLSSLAHVYCGQTPGWIKMPLGVKVGLGPGHIVLHRDPAPSAPLKGGTTPDFRTMPIVAKRSPILATAEQLL